MNDYTNNYTNYTNTRADKLNKLAPLINPIVLITFLVIAIIAFLIGLKVGTSKTPTPAQAQAPQAQATENINKTFEFPIKDANGKVVANIKYIITSAQLMNNILVQGQPYNAVQGKTFLILNLTLTNNQTQTVQLDTRDYIRLSVNNSDELLAADIHNDPVQVLPISTKLTRIGFPIDSNFKSLTLSVGQVQGSKEIIKLHF